MLNLADFDLPIRFVEDSGDYSTYLDRYGVEVYVQHGTGIRLYDFDTLYAARVAEIFGTTKVWRHELEERSISGYADEFENCARCEDLLDSGDSIWVDGLSEFYCDSCVDIATFSCTGCDERHETCSRSIDNGGDYWCESCWSRYFYYCDYCDDAYHEDDDHHHDEEDDWCPVPGGEVVRLRLANGGTLAGDERVTVTLSSDRVTQRALNLINRILYDATPPNVVDENGAHEEWGRWGNLRSYVLNAEENDLDTRWTIPGKPNFTKRVKAAAYKNFGIRLSDDIMEMIGNVASSDRDGGTFHVEITRQLNLEATDFHHSDSCWWQSYAYSRCTLKHNGGFGLRSFDPNGEREIYGRETRGRAWVMPCNIDADGEVTPTFDAEGADGFMVFNGYGNLDNSAGARIIADLTGMRLRKITLYGENYETAMYVNNNVGYLVSNSEHAEEVTTVDWSNLERHSALYAREQAAKVTTEEVAALLQPVSA